MNHSWSIQEFELKLNSQIYLLNSVDTLAKYCYNTPIANHKKLIESDKKVCMFRQFMHDFPLNTGCLKTDCQLSTGRPPGQIAEQFHKLYGHWT